MDQPAHGFQVDKRHLMTTSACSLGFKAPCPQLEWASSDHSTNSPIFQADQVNLAPWFHAELFYGNHVADLHRLPCRPVGLVVLVASAPWFQRRGASPPPRSRGWRPSRLRLSGRRPTLESGRQAGATANSPSCHGAQVSNPPRRLGELVAKASIQLATLAVLSAWLPASPSPWSRLSIDNFSALAPCSIWNERRQLNWCP